MCSLRRRAKSSIGLAGCSMSPFSFFSSSSRNARFVKLRRSYLAAQRLRGYTRKSERASKQVTGARGKIAFPAGKPKSPGGHILKHSQKVWSRSFACWLALLCLWLVVPSCCRSKAKHSKAKQSLRPDSQGSHALCGSRAESDQAFVVRGRGRRQPMAADRMHLKPRHGHEERACQSAWMQMQKRCSTAQDTGQGATWQCRQH